MALVSSSPGRGFESRLFTLGVPSSPTEAYESGEISPSFDASFASSMSISTDPIAQPAPISPPTRVAAADAAALDAADESSMMDCSPAAPQPLLRPLARPTAQLRGSRSGTDVPILKAPPPRPLDRAHSQPSFPFLSSLFKQADDAASPTSSSRKSRARIPSAWNSRHTAPAGGLLQPPPLPPVKRLSEPTVPTFRTTVPVDSSPVRMDVDGSSPGNFLSSPFSSRPHNHPRSVSDTRLPDHPNQSTSSGSSGASERLADFFSCQDLSPIPNSRKRLLDLENSPTPGSTAEGIDSLILNSAAPRRAFDKAATTTSLTSHVARRRGSQNTLGGVNRRPILAAVQSMGPPPPTNAALEYKRHAQQLNGKPMTQKSVRRAYSVADAFATSHVDVSMPDPHRASIATTDSYFGTVGRRAGSNVSVDIGMRDGDARRPPENGSPLAGFRKQEEKGKALPCYRVKEDGLMRIDGETLNRLQSGEFHETIKQYLIIDCRFSYEYEGGHIREAINLSSTDDVERTLLQSESPPEPSTSEATPLGGKTVLIFHCEFSAKRAPTSAKHLRSKDRLKNTADYPNVHYPEVYVLQGGYADYFKSFPERCQGGYLPMDDPEHVAKRSVDLNSFRHQQKRQFSRASSFTFGEGRAAAAQLAAASSSSTTFSQAMGTRQAFERGALTLAPANFVFPATRQQQQSSGGMMITEEEHESGDSSFGTNPGSSPGAGSPCPTSKVGRHSLKIGKEVGGRRPMERAQTSSILMFTR
ncbi:hypothetical protein RQP46_005952 [Phenoliferia psychrophenolica]